MSPSVLQNLSFHFIVQSIIGGQITTVFFALSVSVYRPALNDFHILSSQGKETS